MPFVTPRVRGARRIDSVVGIRGHGVRGFPVGEEQGQIESETRRVGHGRRITTQHAFMRDEESARTGLEEWLEFGP